MDWNELLNRSYAPYSGQPQACVLEGESGRAYAGVRVENISFPESIMASQTAIYTCLSEKDHPKRLILPPSYNGSNKMLEFWMEEYHLKVSYEDSIADIEILKKTAPLKININEELERLLDFAVTPNSQFPVSALLETDEGFITGVNVECSEWRMGLCAERLALSKAIAMGYQTFNKLYVHTRYGEFSSPCGACRQVIHEHMPDKPVHLYHADKSHSYHDINQLLPYSFRNKYLKEINKI